MNVNHARVSLVKALLILAMVLLTFPLHADTTWTTTDGTVYENVQVIRVEDDAITIIFKDGGALIPIFKLPPSLQKKYSYDPVKAKIAADARAKADAENARQLQAEIDLTAKLKLKQQILEAKQTDAARAASATKP